MGCCEVCGETRFEGDFECQACVHPYLDDDEKEEETDEDDDR